MGQDQIVIKLRAALAALLDACGGSCELLTGSGARHDQESCPQCRAAAEAAYLLDATAPAPPKPAPPRPDLITLGEADCTDRQGRQYRVTLQIEARSYIPDLYVTIPAPVAGERDLYDDRAFIAGVMAKLRELGYVGPDFGRAELGMQADNCIALEPPHAFRAWVCAVFGHVDLGARERQA